MKRVNTKSQKVLGANSCVCRSYRGKTDRGPSGPSSILNRVKKNKKKHDKIAKTKLTSIEFLISKALIDSNISHDEFVLVNKMV